MRLTQSTCRCGAQARDGQRVCRNCHAAYMRDWRKTHPLNSAQKKKANCRSYAHVYRDRGKIPRKPCERCGETKAEMHHHDYDQPLLVTWLCRECHLRHHKEALFLEARSSSTASGTAGMARAMKAVT